MKFRTLDVPSGQIVVLPREEFDRLAWEGTRVTDEVIAIADRPYVRVFATRRGSR